MSFSGKVKEEISEVMSSARHCRIAELAVIIELCGKLEYDSDGTKILEISTENDVVRRKYFTLLKKTFSICTSMPPRGEDAETILETVKKTGVKDLNSPVSMTILKQSCCKRAFLRGAYMCAGSMSDPKRSYHLEMVCQREDQATQLMEIMRHFGLEAKTIERKQHFVVYIKEGEGIVDFLNICEAHVSLMSMENERILKDMRNSINRRVNCEAANITKTVNAAAKQLADIELIRDKMGLQELPPNLRMIAEARLDHPDATLSELGGYLDPPVGKSGVNHRLRKLSEIAEGL